MWPDKSVFRSPFHYRKGRRPKIHCTSIPVSATQQRSTAHKHELTMIREALVTKASENIRFISTFATRLSDSCETRRACTSHVLYVRSTLTYGLSLELSWAHLNPTPSSKTTEMKSSVCPRHILRQKNRWTFYFSTYKVEIAFSSQTVASFPITNRMSTSWTKNDNIAWLCVQVSAVFGRSLSVCWKVLLLKYKGLSGMWEFHSHALSTKTTRTFLTSRMLC